MLRETLVLEHVHQRRLPGVIQALRRTRAGAGDGQIEEGSFERGEGGIFFRRRGRRGGRAGRIDARATGTRQEEDLRVLLPQPEGGEDVVEPVEEPHRDRRAPRVVAVRARGTAERRSIVSARALALALVRPNANGDCGQIARFSPIHKLT
jgi:hypothetical protein